MSILFMTGAGISASAGIATYRDGSASWRDPDLEKKSHSSRYGNHLDELWDKHWGPVSRAMALSHPTEAHMAIADFQKKHESIVATQNIDNLHERAGSDNIAHVHGNMSAVCMKCKSKNIATWKEGAPICKDCQSRKTRPDVVLFGEMLNQKMFKGLEKFSGTCSHIIVVGTSLNVFPFATLIMDNLHNPNIETILINKGETPLNKMFDHVFNTEADKVTREVLESVENDLNKELDD